MIGDIPSWALAGAWLVVAVSALVQATLGFGFNILAVPIMSLIHPELAPNPQLVITAVLSSATVVRDRSHLRLGDVGYLLASRPFGGLAGLAVISVAAGFWLDIAIGLIVLAAVGILATDVRLTRNRLTETGAGFASGFTSIVSSIGGPPLILLYRDASGPITRAQLGFVFTIGSLTSIGLRLLGGAFDLSDLMVGLTMLPPMFMGFVAAGPVRSRVDGVGLRGPVLGLSSLAAVSLILRAALGA